MKTSVMAVSLMLLGLLTAAVIVGVVSLVLNLLGIKV